MIYWIGLVAHGFRVAALAFIMASQLELHVNVRNIVVAGLLHDIGKIKLKHKILNKKGELGDLEYEYIKSHPEIGAAMLQKLNFSKDIVQMVLQHHESMDGTGYPKKISGDEIDIGSRILKVADVYDALVSNRSYRKRYSKEDALSIMNEELNSFDLSIFRCLYRIIRKNDNIYIALKNVMTDKIL